MSPRLRVLCSLGDFEAGGAQRQMLETLRRLDRERFEPHLMLAHRVGSLLADVPEDIPIWTCGEADDPCASGKPRQLSRWQRIARLARVLKEQRIDLVYDRTYLATLDAACACVLRPTRRISSAVADPAVQFALYARRPKLLWHAVSRWAYRSANLVLANSEGLRQQLIEFWRLDPLRVEVQPNGFDFARLDQLARESLPATWERSSEGVRLLTVGRIDEDKGHADLLEALEELIHRRGRTELSWEVLGTGPNEALLRNAIAERGLTGHVQLLGVVANPYPFYVASDLFCLPSRSEGSPNVLVEALACGLPVIAADCPSGPREILAEGRFGRLVRPKDPRGLADAIDEFLQNRDSLRARAELGQADVRWRHAVEQTIPALEARLQRIAGDRSHRPGTSGRTP